jgi:hypothetical protein
MGTVLEERKADASYPLNRSARPVQLWCVGRSYTAGLLLGFAAMNQMNRALLLLPHIRGCRNTCSTESTLM